MFESAGQPAALWPMARAAGPWSRLTSVPSAQRATVPDVPGLGSSASKRIVTGRSRPGAARSTPDSWSRCRRTKGVVRDAVGVDPAREAPDLIGVGHGHALGSTLGNLRLDRVGPTGDPRRQFALDVLHVAVEGKLGSVDSGGKVPSNTHIPPSSASTLLLGLAPEQLLRLGEPFRLLAAGEGRSSRGWSVRRRSCG